MSSYLDKFPRCSTCRSLQGHLHMVREMMFGTRQSFLYWECSDCGCLSLHSDPIDLGSYYPSEYYSLKQNSTTSLRKLRDRIYLSRLHFLVSWHRRSDMDVVRRVRLTGSCRLLDVGCGAGHLIADLRELGYNAQGIDPFVAEEIRDRFGVRVYRKSLSELQGTFQVILFRHSLEHMPSQLEALQLARERLAPHGICVVCIPIVSWAWQHYGANWSQLDAPRHFVIHTEKSFHLLAKEAGFRVDRVVFDSHQFQFWASELYQQNKSLVGADPPSGIEMLRLRLLAARLNKRRIGDQAQFYLRRAA